MTAVGVAFIYTNPLGQETYPDKSTSYDIRHDLCREPLVKHRVTHGRTIMTVRLLAHTTLSLSLAVLIGVFVANDGASGASISAFMLGASSLLYLLLRRGDPVPQRVRVESPRGKSRR